VARGPGEAHAGARRRRAQGLSLAEREQAVLQGILTLHEFDASLAKDKLVDDDRRVSGRSAPGEARRPGGGESEARRGGEAAAAAKDASLAQWEQAVLLGVRTLDQYARSWRRCRSTTRRARSSSTRSRAARRGRPGEGDARARDAAGAEGRDLARAAPARGDRRRAAARVLRRALVDASWPIDDQLADLDLLDTEIAAAQAARDKRDQVVAKASPSIDLRSDSSSAR
jgi:hypothetical protein